MDTYTYSCPNCGGKVEYDKKINKLKCCYCKKTFNNLFANKNEKDLPGMDMKELVMYYYTCDKCNHDYVSSINNASKCPYCKDLNDDGIPFPVITFIDNSRSNKSINYIYEDELKSFPKSIRQKYMEGDFKLHYINCDVIDGFVEVKNDNKAIKYFFVNLVVPNIKFEDYRFMYEIGNAGIHHGNLKYNYNISPDLINESIEIKLTSSKTIEKDLIKGCTTSFMKRYKLKSDKGITIYDDLNIKRGLFLPIQIKEINIDNQKCRQYVYGNNIVNEEILIETPSEDNLRRKYRISHFVHTISLFLLGLSFLGLVSSFIMRANGFLFNDGISSIYFIVMLLIFGLSLFSVFTLGKKAKYYYHARKLTKEEYFDQIINNSNYVKVFEVK